MFKNRKAFTLGEILFVFVIIGIIASIGIATVKPWEKAYKHAYIKIFNALSVAIYNHMATVSGTDSFPSTPKDFCNALISYINTANNAKNDPDNNACNLTGDKNDFLDNNPTLEDFQGGKNPKIKLSNGAWLWIGANDGKPFSYTQAIGDDTDTIQYYIVYADLNGDRGPNDTQYNKRLPDIVAFAVTDAFVVVPFGYPKVDQRYLSTHIIYPVTEDDEQKYIDMGGHPSDSMTYYEALTEAYSKKPNKIYSFGMPQTYDLEESLPDDSMFKLVGDDLDSKYVNPPTFDVDMCGDGRTDAEIIADKRDSYCEIKVYNYN